MAAIQARSGPVTTANQAVAGLRVHHTRNPHSVCRKVRRHAAPSAPFQLQGLLSTGIFCAAQHIKLPALAAVAEASLEYEPVTDVQTCEAYKGAAVEIQAGQYLKVINTYGTQVVDFWAMSTATAKGRRLREIMSMHHSHDEIGKLIPQVGDTMVTSQMRPILTLVEDTGPGVHDTLVAACSHELYEKILGIGPDDPHDSCTNNLHTALANLNWHLTDDPTFFLTPGPFNLWMNVPFHSNAEGGKLPGWWAPPAEGQKPGDYVIFRAEMDCVCVMSCCPSEDISQINGPEGTKSAQYQVLRDM